MQKTPLTPAHPSTAAVMVAREVHRAPVQTRQTENRDALFDGPVLLCIISKGMPGLMPERERRIFPTELQIPR